MQVEEFLDLCFKTYQLNHWWPGTSFEIAISAILVQNTNWKGAWKALRNLQQENLTVRPTKLIHIENSVLEQLIRPAGFFKRKSTTIKKLTYLWLKKKGMPTREELLSIKGIGTETADAISLYACNVPTIPIDVYTRRIWKRIPLTPGNPRNDDELRQILIHVTNEDIDSLKKAHAAFVEFGKEFCKKVPQCKACPLKNVCEATMKRNGDE